MQCFIDDSTVATAVRNSRKQMDEMSKNGKPIVTEAMQVVMSACFEMVSAELAREIYRSHPRFDKGLFKRDCGSADVRG